MGRIILMRHGRTYSNASRILDTRPPGAELTLVGKQQARLAGPQLAEVTDDLGGALCSVAIRAQQTALRVINTYEQAKGLARGSVSLEVTPGLQEIFVGDYEGRSEPGAHRAYREALYGWMHDGLGVSMPGGENPRQVLDRYRPVMEGLAARISEDDRDYLLVGHGAAIRIAGRYSSNVPADVAFHTYLANCAMVVLHPTGQFGSWECESWAGVRL